MSYPVGEAGGDDGLLLRARLSHPLPLPPSAGELEGALLAQWGTVRVNHTDYARATGPNEIHLGGAGVELTYQWRQRLSARLAYVHQLGPTEATAGQAHGGEIWSRLRFRF